MWYRENESVLMTHTRTLLFSALLAGALLPGLPAAGEDTADEHERLAATLMERAAALPDGRAKALKVLAAHLPLIAAGDIPVDKAGRSGTTALMLAVALDEAEVVHYLLERGADPTLQDAQGRDALSLADDEVIRTLLLQGSQEAAPAPETRSRCPGDGKGPLLNWAAAESYLAFFLIRHKDGQDYVLDAEGNRRNLGKLYERWAQLRLEGEGVYELAGVLFGTHRATPLISFLLQQAGDLRPQEPFEWYYQAHCAYRLGQLHEEEFHRQRELARPHILAAERQEKNAFRYLRMCAAGGETQLVERLLQKGIPPTPPDSASGDSDIRMELEEIPLLCRAELRDTCALPLAAAALGGHVETLELLLQHHSPEAGLDNILAYACLSRHQNGFEAAEKLLLARGARHSALSLACACAARRDETIERILSEQPSLDRGALTRALLILVQQGVTPRLGHRSTVAEKLVRAGADLQALETMPPGMTEHPLYCLFSTNGTDALALYSSLVSLGLDEEKVLALPMNAEGDTLLSTCDASQRAFLNWNVPPRIVIDAATQRLTIEGGINSFSADVSTGVAGLGSGYGSGRTPVGRFSVYSRHGENAPLMTMFRLRQPVGTWPEAARPGEDGILTRVITLKGEERSNADTRARNIYIHGTPDVEHLGQPASHGCIRLSPEDMVKLFELSYPGMEVIIVPPGGISSN